MKEHWDRLEENVMNVKRRLHMLERTVCCKELQQNHSKTPKHGLYIVIVALHIRKFYNTIIVARVSYLSTRSDSCRVKSRP